MRIEYTGRHLEVPEVVRRLAERKLRKLERVLPGITSAHVTLETDRHRLRAEVTVRSPQLDLSASQASAEMGASLKAAIDKLLQQAQRARGRRRDKKRRASPPARPARKAPAPAGAGAERELRVIKSGGFVAKPMTLDEAVLRMEDRRDGPLVFRDADALRLRVLYWRRDGHLGLIEPEA